MYPGDLFILMKFLGFVVVFFGAFLHWDFVWLLVCRSWDFLGNVYFGYMSLYISIG